MLPFIFAASAVSGGRRVTLSRSTTAVLWAVEAAGPSWSGRPAQPLRGGRRPSQCDAVGVQALRRRAWVATLDKRVNSAGMNELHAAAKEAGHARVSLLASQAQN